MEYAEGPEKKVQSRGRESIELSYSILMVAGEDLNKVLEKFATSINVQLTLQPGQQFPYIPFNGCE
jgi:hypothetical protein